MTLVHKIVYPGINTLNGNGMRRTLQYTGDTPRIDILVRESIQNSFDALNDDAKFLDMHYNVKEFETEKLARELCGITDALIERFENKSYYFEIRDINTVGLDGPLESRKLAEYGRLMKLVYSIAEKQEGSGKGGSWGYGKTNYFNVGIGLVIYYTRTRYNGEYQERLVATLVEDTDHREDMLFKSDLGISYWGIESKIDDRALPLTDSSEIKRILDIMSIKQYSGDETGTSVIIPFIDRRTLLEEMLLKIFDEEEHVDVKVEEFQYYVELAVQRWYFPRLLNRENVKPLRFTFNDHFLSDEEIQPVFHIMQEIYNNTFTDKSESVMINSGALSSKSTIAKFSDKTVKIADLGKDKGMSIYDMLELVHDPKKPNTPVGFRCRSLGMINCYETEEGIVKGAIPSQPDECLIVGLRPIPDIDIIDPDTQDKITNLEQYIRKGENPAHTTWADLNLNEISHQSKSTTPRIITNMIKGVSDHYSNKALIQKHGTKKNIGLSKKIGKIFLPDRGFGTGSTPKPPRGKKTHTTHTSIPSTKLGKTSIKYHKDCINVEFPIEFNDDSPKHTVILSPMADNEMSLESWEKICGIKFPTYIDSFEITSINKKQISTVLIADNQPKMVGMSRFIPIFNSNGMYAIEIIHPKELKNMSLMINFKKNKSVFKFNISVKEGGVHND